MNESSLTEQLKALYEATHVPQLAPEEFTCSMFRAATGCTKATAETLLANAVKEGGIRYVGERLHDGKRVKAYRFVNETNQD